MPTGRFAPSTRLNVKFPWARSRSSRHTSTINVPQPGFLETRKCANPRKMAFARDGEVSGDWSLWASHPQIQDSFKTETSATQDDTVELLLPFLDSDEGPPRLERGKHIEYLHSCLGNLPDVMVVLDASRPWQIYWSLAALSLLGNDVTQYRSRYTRRRAEMLQMLQMLKDNR